MQIELKTESNDKLVLNVELSRETLRSLGAPVPPTPEEQEARARAEMEQEEYRYQQWAVTKPLAVEVEHRSGGLAFTIKLSDAELAKLQQSNWLGGDDNLTEDERRNREQMKERIFGEVLAAICRIGYRVQQ